MNISHKHRAAELLRECANDADCNNDKLLRHLQAENKRLGGALAGFCEENGSKEKQELLPTLKTLKSALLKISLSCKCSLCVPTQDQSSSSKDVVFRDDRIEDYAKLILCGCLFLVRNSAFNQSKSLADFIISRQKSQRKEDLDLFGRLATQPEGCSVPHTDEPVKWMAPKVSHLQTVCNKCRWKAFMDAFHLKTAILNVVKIPGEFNPQDQADLLDMSNFNVPFINLKRPDIKRANIEFYINEIHPDYSTFGQIEPQVYQP